MKKMVIVVLVLVLVFSAGAVLYTSANMLYSEAEALAYIADTTGEEMVAMSYYVTPLGRCRLIVLIGDRFAELSSVDLLREEVEEAVKDYLGDQQFFRSLPDDVWQVHAVPYEVLEPASVEHLLDANISRMGNMLEIELGEGSLPIYVFVREDGMVDKADILHQLIQHELVGERLLTK